MTHPLRQSRVEREGAPVESEGGKILNVGAPLSLRSLEGP